MAIHALWNTMENTEGAACCLQSITKALEDWTRKYDKYLRDPDVRACRNLIEGALQRGGITEEEYQIIMGFDMLTEQGIKRYYQISHRT